MVQQTISVVVITYNEENNIKDCLKSASILTDHIIHIDTSSTDNTVPIARSMGIKSIVVPHLGIVEPVRNQAIKNVSTDWFFLLDADERITPEMANEIKKAINTTPYSHFIMPRKNIFAEKKWLAHGGWYPDIVCRLIKKSEFCDWPETIHSSPVIKGKRGELSQALIHYFHSDIKTMVNKTINYEQKVANLLFEARREVRLVTFFRKFGAELIKRYILKSGFLDGKYGLLEAIYQAYSQSITWLFLWEKYQTTKI